MKQTVVLYPGLGVGHLIPMVELGRVFLKHGYAVTIALIELPTNTSAFKATVDRVASSNPSINFHVLPPVPLPDYARSDTHPFLNMLDLLRRYNDPLQNFLCSIPLQCVHSLVIDMFTVDAIDAAAELKVPVYTFFPSGATTLAILAQIPSFCANRKTGLKELGDKPLDFHGAPPMPASHLIKEMLEHPTDELYKAMMKVWARIPEPTGILVNTFEFFESRAMRALREPLRLPSQVVLPPVYCVGPLVGKGEKGERAYRHECLAWLDEQPEHSVVFLCFGSMGSLPEEQLKEMAIGLEKSKHRFLWVVRTPCSDDLKFFDPRPEPDLDALLPEGFLERTKDRGLVVKSWAPQVDVLRHSATGAFVTHCGWNSTLEAITAGVPMLCWPLQAEQKMNKVLMVREMGLGVEMKGYMEGLVKAEEVEAKVRLVMESEEGKELRGRVVAHKEAAEEALKDGGSSHAAFVAFLWDVENLLMRLAHGTGAE